MRKLRPFYSETELRRMYEMPYKHTYWPEHIERVDQTTKIAQLLIDTHGLETVADLSCGDGAIVRGLERVSFSHMCDYTHNGDGIEVTIKHLKPVDLFICTETIEHLEAPWTVLEHIAQRTKWLVLSTPLDEDTTENWEHYWSFTRDDVKTMLTQSGFDFALPSILAQPGWAYVYQIWIARASA